MSRFYTPWNRNYRRAALLATLSVLVLAIAWALGQWQQIVLASLGALVLLLLAGRQYRQGLARSRGIRVERATTRELRSYLQRHYPEIGLRTDVSAGRIGNIDAVLGTAIGQVTVEIKSQSNSERINALFDQHAKQARKQKDVLKARLAVLWYPESTLDQYHLNNRDLLVIYGEVPTLIGGLRAVGGA